MPSLRPRRSLEEFRILQQFLQSKDVLIVFGTDVFPEAGAFAQHHRGAGLEWLREDLFVFDGGFVVDGVVIDPCVPFCNVKRVGVKDSSEA